MTMWSRFVEEKSTATQKLVDDATCQLFLFEHNGTTVGFSKVYLDQECFPDEDLPELCLHILAFYILPEFRRHHLGEMAFKLLRQWGRDNKAALIEIEADSDESGRFLKEQGLDLVGKGVHRLFRGFV